MKLRQLVDQSAESVSSNAVRFNGIINDINPCLQVNAGIDALERVVCFLLSQAHQNPAAKDIRIDAKTFHNIVLMKIKYSGAGYDSNIENLQEVKELIGSLGGCLYISCNKSDETTVSFTFLSHCFSMFA